MYTLNEKIRDLTPYEPIKGEYPIRLDANESFIQAPADMINRAAAKLASGINRYPDALAAELCAAFAKQYGVDAANVAAGNGSDELISVIFGGFLMKGEKFATLAYDFSMYDFYGSISEGVKVKIEKNDDFSVDVDKVIDICNREEIKLLIFSNPCNPTSLGLKKEEVRKIITSVKALVVLDEAYMDFWDQSLLAEVSDYDNLLILKTCSKAFGLAAIRVGFAVGNETLIRAIKAVKSPYNVNSFSQFMAAELLSDKASSDAALKEILDSKEELDSAIRELNEKYSFAQYIPQSVTNFITIKTDIAGEIFEHLLTKGIAIRNFGAFLRITAGAPEENAMLLEELESFFKTMQ